MANQEPPIALDPPDISARQGNTGIPYFTTLESGRPGPHALVLGLIHGNELCGAIALEHLLASGFRPAHGKVTLGFANVAAYRRFDRRDPTASRFVDEDLNRVWDPVALASARRTSELDRAREVRPLIDTVDWLLDLHSMQLACEPLALAGLGGKGTALARRMGLPAVIVEDAGHAAGRRLRDYGQFVDPASPAAAVLVECGRHWAADAATVAISVTRRFLDALGYLDPPLPAEAPSPQRVIRVTEAVTIATDRFRFTRDFSGLEEIPDAGTPIATDGTREIRTPYPGCVLVMPTRRPLRGQTAVRLGRFVG